MLKVGDQVVYADEEGKVISVTILEDWGRGWWLTKSEDDEPLLHEDVVLNKI